MTTLGGLVPGACPCETTDFSGHAHITLSAYRVLIWVCVIMRASSCKLYLYTVIQSNGNAHEP